MGVTGSSGGSDAFVVPSLLSFARYASSRDDDFFAGMLPAMPLNPSPQP